MKSKINVITSGLFLALLFGFAITFFLLPDNSFSEQENRSLRTFPTFSWERLANGEFAQEINDYFADQFPLRDAFVGIKGMAEISLGKGENNGILLGENGQLADRLFDVKTADGTSVSEMDAFDAAHVLAATQGLNRVSESLNVPFSTLLTGRTIDVAASAFSYPTENSDALLDAVYSKLRERAGAISTVPMLRERFDNGEYVYYRTDHHWTTLGAYYAYAEVMKSFGMEADVIPAEDFERRVVSTAFYGTAWSAGGMKFIPPDSIEFWLYGNEDEFAVVADGEQIDGFYNEAYLQKKDQYSAFLDGTHDVVTITKTTESDRPTLLLLKDSFANSIAPFLAQHFDLVLLNLSSARKDHTNVSSFAEEYGADRVLLVYTLENVVTDDKLSRLR